jgi:predicted ABC-type ATPase
MFAGPNGSGKSTLTALLQRRPGFPNQYINPDEIALTLPGDPMERAYEAARIAEQRRQQFLNERQSFAFETVMSHPSKVAFLSQARRAGYEVNLVFIATHDPAINIDRVRERVQEGGHNVPSNKIIERYHRTLSLLPAAIESSSHSILYDNTSRLTVCAEFQDNQLIIENEPYLQLNWIQRTVRSLQERINEREQLGELAQLYQRRLIDAENQQQYRGIIETCSSHFSTQVTDSQTLILHEANFLNTSTNAGQWQQISYREGAGLVEREDEPELEPNQQRIATRILPVIVQLLRQPPSDIQRIQLADNPSLVIGIEGIQQRLLYNAQTECLSLVNKQRGELLRFRANNQEI